MSSPSTTSASRIHPALLRKAIKSTGTMNTKRLSYPPGIGDWLVASLSILCTLTFSPEAQATPPKNTVVATVNVGSSPGGLVCSPDSNFVYVSIAGGIAVIDTTTNQLSTNFSVPGSQSFLAIAPDGKTLYASAIVNTSGGVQVISTADGSVTTTIPIFLPSELTLTPDGSQLWVCNSINTGGIYIVDTASNTVVGGPITISGQVPVILVFTPNGTDAFALYSEVGSIPMYLVQIDALTQTIKNSNFAGKALHGSSGLRQPTILSMDPNGKTMYVYDTAAKFLIEAVAVKSQKAKGISPRSVDSDYCQTMTPNGKYLYIYEAKNVSTDATIKSISTETGEVVGRTVTVGLPDPINFELPVIAVAPNGKYAYVSNNSEGTVTVIDIQE